MRHLILSYILASIFFSFSVNAIKVNVVTEDAYPFQYIKNNKIVGPTTDLVKKLLTEAHVDYEINMYPWARAYNLALSKPNTIIYSIARTKEREDKFLWIGSLMQLKYALYGLENITISPTAAITELNNYKIGVVRLSAIHQYLKSHGVTNFDLVGAGKQNIQKLLQGRVDLIPANETSFQMVCLHLKFNCNKVTMKYPLPEPSTHLWVAISKNSDPQLVRNIQAAFDRVFNTK
jgi:polar amino acid transport system substrate-binding protein